MGSMTMTNSKLPPKLWTLSASLRMYASRYDGGQRENTHTHVKEQFEMFRVLAAILHLGNVSFEDVPDNDAARLSEGNPSLKYAADLLGCNPKAIENTLVSRTLVAGGESVTTSLGRKKAENSRDSLAMLL